MTPSVQNWIQCPPGYYSEANQWICLPCPERYHCPMRQDTKTLNEDGYWSPLGTHIDLVVPAGWKAG
jgi:hypothetical protein